MKMRPGRKSGRVCAKLEENQVNKADKVDLLNHRTIDRYMAYQLKKNQIWSQLFAAACMLLVPTVDFVSVV